MQGTSRQVGLPLRAVRSVALVTVGLIGPLVSFVAFGSTGRDDPYITFAAAEQFQNYGFIANLNGDPIEQSTSLLFAVALALLGSALPVPTFVLGWVLSFLGLSAVGVVSLLLLKPYVGWTAATGAAVAVVLLPPLSYWAASGAEQTWVTAALLAIGLSVACWGDQWVGLWSVVAPTLLWLLLFLLRPDAGIAVLAAFVVMAVVTSMPSGRAWGAWQQWARVAVISGVFLVIVTLLRWVITNTPLPQSVMAKAQPGYEAWDWSYVTTNLFSPYFLVIIAVGVLLALGYRKHLPSFDRVQVFLAVTAIVLIVLLMRSGPDWMEVGRLWIPPAVLLGVLLFARMRLMANVHAWLAIGAVLAANFGTIALWSVDTSRATYGVGLSGSRFGDRWELVGSSQPLSLWPAADSPYNTWNSVHAKDAQFLSSAVPLIETYLERNPQRPVTVGAGDAGMVFYFLQQEFGDDLEFVDRWSLISPSFSSCAGVNRTPVGTGMSFTKWIRWEQISEPCVPELPDIVFDNDAPTEEDLGVYELVHQQDGAWVRSGAEVRYGNAMWLGFKKP